MNSRASSTWRSSTNTLPTRARSFIQVLFLWRSPSTTNNHSHSKLLILTNLQSIYPPNSNKNTWTWWCITKLTTASRISSTLTKQKKYLNSFLRLKPKTIKTKIGSRILYIFKISSNIKTLRRWRRFSFPPRRRLRI